MGIGELFRRVLYLVHQRQADTDLAEELSVHCAMKVRELEGGGADPRNAALDARRAMGSTALAHDRAHDVWVPHWLQDAMQDVRFALRLLAKERRFSIVAVLVLSVGLAVNNTFFTIVDAICLRGLQVNQVDRVLSISMRDVHGQRLGVSHRDFLDIQAGTKAFAGVAASADAPMTIGDTGRSTDRVTGSYVSAGAFTVLRKPPLIGRSFAHQDDRPGANAVVLLSNNLWQSRYGSDPSVVGRTIRVNGRPALVVGVMPDGFRFPNGTDLWEPLAQMPKLVSQGREVRPLAVFGRLLDAATMAQAQAELSGLATRLAHDYPETNKGIRAIVSPINEGFTQPLTNPAWTSFILAGFFVLLIACANVANLLLMHAVGRTHEIAMRVSLGATRLRIVRQLLAESALLAIVGAGLGFVLSTAALRWFVSAIPSSALPFWTRIEMDYRVFAVLAGVSLATVFIFGLVPALHLSKTDVQGALKEGSRGGEGRRTRRRLSVFLTAELALAMLLLYGMGTGVRSVFDHARTDLEINPAQLLTASVALPDGRYPTSERRLAFYERLLDRLRETRSIAAAGITSALPLSGGATRELAIDGYEPTGDTPPPTVEVLTIAETYFRAMDLRMVRGRAFDAMGRQTSAKPYARSTLMSPCTACGRWNKS
jgi:predicted permease